MSDSSDFVCFDTSKSQEPVCHPDEDVTFGHGALREFLLEPGLTYLNHGAYGAVSRPVMLEAQKIRAEIEAQPSRFMKQTLPTRLRDSASVLGDYVGAKGKDIVFLDNATTAANAVLRSLMLLPGDEVLTTSQAYGAVLRTLEFICDRAEARLVSAHLDFPVGTAQDVVDAFSNAITSRTRLVVMDHITSKTATLFPVASVAALCAERGIPVLVDGAHAPGMVPLDIESLGVTWYVGNCHKWLGAARGAGFLWTLPERQATVRPTTISHFVANGYNPAFDWPGTKDFTAYLTIPAALAFRARFGEEELRRHCHELAVDMGEKLADALGTRVGTNGALMGSMATVELPRQFNGASQSEADSLRATLRNDHSIEVDIQSVQGRLWVRLSAYIYNDLTDIDRLLAALNAVAPA